MELRGFEGAQGSSMPQALRKQRSRNIWEARRLIRCTSQRVVSLSVTTPMWQGSLVSGRPFCRYAEYRQAERQNEVAAYRDWCIFQVRLGNPGQLQKRQGNLGSIRAGAHHREPTPPSTPTDRQVQGVLQLEFLGPYDAPWYPPLCQWDRAKGSCGWTIQPHHQDQDNDIFVGPGHRVLCGCHPGLGWRLQQLAPPLQRHGSSRYPTKGREPFLNATFRGRKHSP